MESTKQKTPNLSKYVISNIIKQLPINDILTLRLVCKKFDEAALIGINVLIYEYK